MLALFFLPSPHGFFSLEIQPCCPTVSPVKKVVVAGTSFNFTCVVDMSKSLPKYLSFKWFKEVNGTYLEIPDKQTHRKSGSTSVLMIKNVKTTPPGGTLYKCQMSYRGKTSSYRPRLVVFSGEFYYHLTMIIKCTDHIE